MTGSFDLFCRDLRRARKRRNSLATLSEIGVKCDLKECDLKKQIGFARNARKEVILMAELHSPLELEVERGPDWLFVRLRDEAMDFDRVAEQLWDLLEKHFIYRLVLEMDELKIFPSQLMGQLVMLQKRVLQHGGALRLCSLSPECQSALHFCRLDHALPNFPTREDAVYGRDNLVKPR